jgi:hypothetical protein
MVIKKKKAGKIEIDLTGPEVNAFFILGVAGGLCKQLDRDADKVRKEMMSGDYENLIKVFEKEFGDLVILYR